MLELESDDVDTIAGYYLTGVGTIQHTLGENASKEVADFLVDALFSTITNANFDDQSILK